METILLCSVENIHFDFFFATSKAVIEVIIALIIVPTIVLTVDIDKFNKLYALLYPQMISKGKTIIIGIIIK